MSTTAQPPVYATLMALGLTTTLAASWLFILFTGAPRHVGAVGINAAMSFRFLLNGVPFAVGAGNTPNQITFRIASVSYSRRILVAAGLQTVTVEWAYFGPVGQTVVIDPVTNPDLTHAHLLLQEHRI